MKSFFKSSFAYVEYSMSFLCSFFPFFFKVLYLPRHYGGTRGQNLSYSVKIYNRAHHKKALEIDYLLDNRFGYIE